MTTLTKNNDRQTATQDARRTSYATPLANIRETKEGYLLEVELPGVSKEGLEITVENNELTIIGRRSDAAVPGDVVYRESRPLDYRRVFELDPSIDTGRINAKVESGVLKLTLNKAESLKPRKIEVTD